MVALSELEIGLVAFGFTLTIFGAQGLVSVALEGRQVRPGKAPPRLPDALGRAIVALACALCGDVVALSVALGVGIVAGWPPDVLGTLAGLGALALAALLILYKEAFVGDEAAFEDRDDGIPW
ncbi:MAG TPA: hypothetical protein VFW96_15720 [Thermomicrobiales bacterium]|nr:hypothetical protein [Thermomicrobiales bacterium]